MEIAAHGIWSERLRLAELSKEEMAKLGLIAVMIGLVFLMFHVQGNTTDVRMYGRSAILWMVERWNSSGGDFSHGYLIPFVSLGLVWYKRRELAEATKSVSRAGLTVIILALLMHWLGAKAQQTRLSLMALVLLIWGVPFYLLGWEVAKSLMFPCAYLIFCIPLNFLDSITFPLRMISTVFSTALLNGLGLPVEQSGTRIVCLAAGGFNLEVADPCSGLRSLMAMTALTSVYAYVTQKTLLKKWILFLCSIPIAMVGNMIRITTIALVAQAFGQKIAMNLYHDYSGYIVFAAAITLMVSVGTLLNVDFRVAGVRWKHKFLSPTL
jgi:exosortase